MCGAALRNANGPSSSIKGQNVFALLEQSGAADEEVELHWDTPKYTRIKVVCDSLTKERKSLNLFKGANEDLHFLIIRRENTSDGSTRDVILGEVSTSFKTRLFFIVSLFRRY